MPYYDRWSVSNWIEAGGRSELRRALEKDAWSPKPVAKANPDGYWRSVQGACAVALTFETGLESPGAESHALRVVIDLDSWRGCEALAGNPASQRRWGRVLIAATEAQCKLRHGPEGALARQTARAQHPLHRAIIKAVSKDAVALAPLLDPRFWPGPGEILPPSGGFIDSRTCEPSGKRALPLIQCRFVASKPLGAEQARLALASIKAKLTAAFGVDAVVEAPVGARLGSLQWRSMLEGLSIANDLTPGDSGRSEMEPSPAVKAAKPRL